MRRGCWASGMAPSVGLFDVVGWAGKVESLLSRSDTRSTDLHTFSSKVSPMSASSSCVETSFFEPYGLASKRRIWQRGQIFA